MNIGSFETTPNITPTLTPFEKQCFYEGAHMGIKQKIQDKIVRCNEVANDRIRVEQAVNFQRNADNLARQYKRDQQQELTMWFKSKMNEKVLKRQFEKNDAYDFAKNKFNFFDKWGTEILPHYKNFQNHSQDPTINNQRTMEYKAFVQTNTPQSRGNSQEPVSPFNKGKIARRLSGLKKICKYDNSDKLTTNHDQNSQLRNSVTPIRKNSSYDFPQLNKSTMQKKPLFLNKEYIQKGLVTNNLMNTTIENEKTQKVLKRKNSSFDKKPKQELKNFPDASTQMSRNIEPSNDKIRQKKFKFFNPYRNEIPISQENNSMNKSLITKQNNSMIGKPNNNFLINPNNSMIGKPNNNIFMKEKNKDTIDLMLKQNTNNIVKKQAGGDKKNQENLLSRQVTDGNIHYTPKGYNRGRSHDNEAASKKPLNKSLDERSVYDAQLKEYNSIKMRMGNHASFIINNDTSISNLGILNKNNYRDIMPARKQGPSMII